MGQLVGQTRDATALTASECSAAPADAPMSYLHTCGPAADPITRLNTGLLTISGLVTVIIGALVLWAALRRRPPATDARSALGPPGGGLPWIYIGVGISAIVLLGAAVWTLSTLAAVASPPIQPAARIDVIGHQWWWEVRYAGDRASDRITTANEIHIPVGQPVLLTLDSADVIHSFWVPRLAGKTDLIPGQTNHAWLQADRPGEYRGQCGEYCGAQHAHMALSVIAEPAATYTAWRQRQATLSAAPQGADAVRGMAVFMSRCSMCHTVRGTDAQGALGPDLTHLMSRRRIAAGLLPNNTGSLGGWVADAPALKPGTRMPAMDLEAPELRAVVAYLETLQ